MEKPIQIRKPLTWAKLKEKIEKMSEEELNENVKIWSEEIPLESECYLEKENEDLYYHEDFDYCYPESELDNYTKEECVLVLEKGKYFLTF